MAKKGKFCALLLIGSLAIANLSACNGNGEGLALGTELKEDTGKETRDWQEEIGQGTDKKTEERQDESSQEAMLKDMEQQLIFAEGETLETRIAPPDSYKRVAADDGSLAAFLRTYLMKEDKSPVLLYDGRKKGNQKVHAAVFALPIEPEDLQQCADSVMRVYAEYFWHGGRYERIVFHFTNGFLAEYSKWRDGYRIKVNGNNVTWEKQAGYDDSYECFQKYLRIVFSYAGTLSMEAESKETDLENLAVGDIFIKGGSPGHVVMIVDVCEDAQGKKAFLLGQGYMPAQEFHVLTNPKHDGNPWYYEDEVEYPFATPEYTFEKGSLRRLCY